MYVRVFFLLFVSYSFNSVAESVFFFFFNHVKLICSLFLVLFLIHHSNLIDSCAMCIVHIKTIKIFGISLSLSHTHSCLANGKIFQYFCFYRHSHHFISLHSLFAISFDHVDFIIFDEYNPPKKKFKA